MKKLVAGREVEVNEEGYLIDPSQWDESIANAIAQEESVGPLTEAHMKLIRNNLRFGWQDLRMQTRDGYV